MRGRPTHQLHRGLTVASGRSSRHVSLLLSRNLASLQGYKVATASHPCEVRSFSLSLSQRPCKGAMLQLFPSPKCKPLIARLLPCFFDSWWSEKLSSENGQAENKEWRTRHPGQVRNVSTSARSGIWKPGESSLCPERATFGHRPPGFPFSLGQDEGRTVPFLHLPYRRGQPHDCQPSARPRPAPKPLVINATEPPLVTSGALFHGATGLAFPVTPA